MKKFLLGAAAALAIAVPGVAAADTNGYVSFGYNSLDDDTDGFKENYIQLDGAVVTDLGPSWNLQFDGGAQDMDHGDHTDNMSTLEAHAFMRNDAFAFGGFGGFTNGETDGYFLGAEGAVYLGRFTLNGSAFFGGDRADSSGSELTGYGASGTFFITDNFSIGADASNYEFFDGAQDGTVYGINAEFQFGNAFSIFGGYHTSDNDYFGTDREVNSFTIGGRYNFGTDSLIQRDRSGASMPGARQLDRAQVFGW